MIPHAAGLEGAGLDCISKKSNLTGAFETFSRNVSPGLFQIERRGKCQCRFLSAKSVKSALSVASCACQQDNCPLLLVFLDPFARIWKSFLTFSVHMFAPQRKDQRPQNKKSCLYINIYLLPKWKSKLLFFTFSRSVQGEGRYNRRSVSVFSGLNVFLFSD